MYQYPHTIENKFGEKLVFVDRIKEPEGDKLITEGFVKPGAGPPIHVHWKQEESLTVISGKMGILIPGQEPVYYGPGETATFMRGTWHKFWNAGEDELHVKGWIKPANNVEYFLEGIYKALDEGKHNRPEIKRIAFLSMHYRSEFATADIPAIVTKVIIPATYYIGKLTGAHKKFTDAPAPLK